MIAIFLGDLAVVFKGLNILYIGMYKLGNSTCSVHILEMLVDYANGFCGW